MTDDRIDFAPLDPTEDPQRFDRIVGAIAERAAEELAARRLKANVFGQVVHWWKPLLAAAAITGIVSISALARLQDSAPESETEIGLAEAIGVPEQVADWIRNEDAPTPAELLVTLEDG